MIDDIAASGVMTICDPAEAERQLVFLPRVAADLIGDPDDPSRSTQLSIMARALARDGGLFHVRDAVVTIEGTTYGEREYLASLWETWHAGRTMTGLRYYDPELVDRPRFRRALADHGVAFEPAIRTLYDEAETRWMMMADDNGIDTEAAFAGAVEIAWRLSETIKD